MKKMLSIMVCVLLLSSSFTLNVVAEDSGTLKATISEQKEAVKKAETDLEYFVSRNDPSIPAYSTFKGAYANKVKEEKKKLRALEKQSKEQAKP